MSKFFLLLKKNNHRRVRMTSPLFQGLEGKNVFKVVYYSYIRTELRNVDLLREEEVNDLREFRESEPQNKKTLFSSWCSLALSLLMLTKISRLPLLLSCNIRSVNFFSRERII